MSDRKVEPAESEASDTKSSLEQEEHQNFFNTVGFWNTNTLRSITATFPPESKFRHVIDRKAGPKDLDKKLWKHPITFSDGTDRSVTMRIDNVVIPYSAQEGYGTDFVYLCLPEALAEFLSVAGRKCYPINVQEGNLRGKKGEWWKVAYDVGKAFSAVNVSLQEAPVPLTQLLRTIRGGINANLILRFFCEARIPTPTQEDPDIIKSIGVEVLRGYVININRSVRCPFRTDVYIPEPLKQDLAGREITNILTSLGW